MRRTPPIFAGQGLVGREALRSVAHGHVVVEGSALGFSVPVEDLLTCRSGDPEVHVGAVGIPAQVDLQVVLASSPDIQTGQLLRPTLRRFPDGPRLDRQEGFVHPAPAQIDQEKTGYSTLIFRPF